MGRKSYPYGPSRKQIPWTEDDTSELLARLDFIVESQKEENVKEHEIVVLRKLAVCFKPHRTQDQIKRKLARLVQDYSSQGRHTDHHVVYRLGTCYLDAMHDEMRMRVNAALDVIRWNETYKFISSPRATRSASRRVEGTPGRQKRSQSLFRDYTPIDPARKQRRLNVRSPSARIIKTEPSSSRRLLVENSPSARSSVTPQPEVPPPRLNFSNLNDLNASHEGLDEPRQQSTHENPRILTPFYDLPVLDRPSVDYGQIREVEDVDFFVARGQMTVQDLFRDNLFFRAKISALEEEVAEYQRQKRLQYSLKALRRVGSEINALEGRIDRQDKEISTWKQRSHSRDIFRPLLEPNATEQILLLRDNLESHHIELTRAMKILGTLDIPEIPPQREGSSRSPDLISLGCRAFGEGRHQELLGKTSPYNNIVIQALVGAAVCDWVFLDRIQWIATISSPLLEAYRRQICAIWGEDTAHALDSMAHRSLIEKEEFVANRELSLQEEFRTIFLPRTATRLTERFLAAVQLLPDSSESLVDFKRLLQSIFNSAVSMKMRAMIGRNATQVIWPPYDSSYSPFGMNEDKSEFEAEFRETDQTRKVLFCLVPGVRICPGQTEGFVDYQGLTLEENMSFSSSDVTLPALVVTQ